MIISGLLLYECKYTYLQPSAFYLGLSIMLSAEVNARIPDFARGVLQDFPRHSAAGGKYESIEWWTSCRYGHGDREGVYKKRSRLHFDRLMEDHTVHSRLTPSLEHLHSNFLDFFSQDNIIPTCQPIAF